MARHPGSIDKHGNRWRVRLSVGGERNVWTLEPGATRKDAEAFARAKEEELRRRHERGLPGPVRISKLLDTFEDRGMEGLAENTRKTYGISLDTFRRYFVDKMRDPRLDLIRVGTVEDYLHWRRWHRPDGTRREKALSARSVNKDRTTLHRVFELAMRREWIDRNPVTHSERAKGDKREPLILTAEQYDSLFEACEPDPMLHTFVAVLGEAGLRCESEALWLRWDDIDLVDGWLTVESVRKGRRSKSGRIRDVVLTERLQDALLKHYALFHGKLDTPWVFHHPRTHRKAVVGERQQSLRYRFNLAVRAANLNANLVQHDLRHRRVTTWLADGHPVHLVQQAMGHSDIKTTLGYYRFVREHLTALRQPRQTVATLADAVVAALESGDTTGALSKALGGSISRAELRALR